MLTIQVTPSRPWISLWTILSAERRRVVHRWAMARQHRRMLEQLATLSDHQLRDVGLEESPYHEGALHDACNLKACLADRWAPHFLPEAKPRHWP